MWSAVSDEVNSKHVNIRRIITIVLWSAVLAVQCDAFGCQALATKRGLYAAILFLCRLFFSNAVVCSFF